MCVSASGINMRKCDLQMGTSQKVSKKKNSLMLVFGGKDIGNKYIFICIIEYVNEIKVITVLTRSNLSRVDSYNYG